MKTARTPKAPLKPLVLQWCFGDQPRADRAISTATAELAICDARGRRVGLQLRIEETLKKPPGVAFGVALVATHLRDGYAFGRTIPTVYYSTAEEAREAARTKAEAVRRAAIRRYQKKEET